MKNILVVEDDLDIASLIAVHLQDFGAQAHLCHHGQDSLRQALSGGLYLIILDLLKNTHIDAKQRRSYLGIAYKQSSRLIRLVTELFELAKLDSCETLLNVEAFSLAELVHDVGSKFRLRAEKHGIALEVNCPPGLPFA